jgi:hypothetical protein
MAGIRDSVIVETQPGRIEAVILAPHDPAAETPGEGAGEPAAVDRSIIDRAVKTANSTLAVHQRVAGWRLWPDDDFPRTHTFKVKRDQVRAWVGAAAPLPVREEAAPSR